MGKITDAFGGGGGNSNHEEKKAGGVAGRSSSIDVGSFKSQSSLKISLSDGELNTKQTPESP